MTRLDEEFAGLPPRLSVEGLAQVMGIEVQTAYRWLQEGRVPAYKIGRTWVIVRDEVKDLLESSSNQARGQEQGPSTRGDATS